MIRFSKYAEQKFEILNKYQVFLRREQVEEALRLPDSTGKKGNYFYASKNKVKVVYQQEGDVVKVITFYPTK